MSSEPAERNDTGRCLFCSLGCPLQVEEFSPQRWRPWFNGGTGGTCARGQMVPDLLHSPTRLYRPRGSGLPASTDAALDRLRGQIGDTGDGRVVIWLDAGLSLEDLVAAHAFCQARPDRRRLLIHVPPWELGTVEGLDAAGVTLSAPAEWAGADGFLVIGNPGATHPACAKMLLRLGAARGRTPFVVIDSAASVLTACAVPALICQPGHEFWVAAALLNALGFAPRDVIKDLDVAALERVASVTPTAIQQAAGRLRNCRRPAAVIAPQSGRRETWRAATALAGTWAKKQGGLVSGLTVSPNALAFARYARRHNIQDWYTAAVAGQAEPADVLLAIGWDPTGAYPRALWEPMVRPAGQAVLVSAFPPHEVDAFHACVPVALSAEAGGSYVLAGGRVESVTPVMPPPAGVPTVRELLTRVGGPAAAVPSGGLRVSDCEAGPVQADLRPPVPPKVTATEEGWPVVLVADPTQYHDGHLTRHTHWSQRVEPLPELRVAPADALMLGVREGQHVHLRNRLGAALVRVTLAAGQPTAAACYGGGQAKDSGGQPSGWLAVGGSTAAVRQLSGLRFGQGDEAAAAGLIMVKLDVDVPRSAQQETTLAAR